MWETLAEKGIGSLLRPWQIRRDGRARLEVRSDEIVGIAQAERDADDIRSGRKQLDAGGQLRALLPEPVVRSVDVVEVRPERSALQAATGIARDNLLADAVRKEVNIAKAVLAAEAELEGDAQEPSAQPIDQDWLFRWRDCAAAVSADELQSLWGRVLAGEVKSPGSFSLRTLEFLKNLSQAEAIAIANVSRFVVDGNIICRGDLKLLEAEGISYGLLLSMQQLGVLSGVESTSLTVKLASIQEGSFFRPLVSHNRILVVTGDDPAKEISVLAFLFTAIGREVVKLGSFEPHEGYLRSLGRHIRTQGFRVEIGRWRRTTAEGGMFSEAEEIGDA